MKIDTEHLHFWMQAIRQSQTPLRTLDAFWQGQLRSKEWLIQELSKRQDQIKPCPNITIYGGWVGVLASMLFQSDISINHIKSIDIDPSCEATALLMNNLEFHSGKFNAITADMCTFYSQSEIIINTSCEHINQRQYEQWLIRQPQNSLLVLQSNNFNIPEHIRIANSLEEFKEQSKLKEIWSGKLETTLYNRWMIIGYK